MGTTDIADPVPIHRPRWRARLVRGFVAMVVVGQVLVLVRGYHDPHVFFAFQPFNESSTWEADIVRVTVDGRRIPIEDAWPGGYDWDTLVGWSVLEDPGRRKHAFSSLAASVDFLDESLDWVADHTPDDAETMYLEASVTGYRNTRGPLTWTLRSDTRDEIDR